MTNKSAMDNYEVVLKKFMREMNQNSHHHNEDQADPAGGIGGSVEVNWTLGELENIVYDFINFNPKH